MRTLNALANERPDLIQLYGRAALAEMLRVWLKRIAIAGQHVRTHEPPDLKPNRPDLLTELEGIRTGEPFCTGAADRV